ncbi:hypothetical protein IFM89_018851 [Coptis chinensis]|uniref:Uncharacterized protein n=1 Tax=Coptis chinensis TaxID=261450 RepID=A0A835M3Y7_9MAGN|nr:hypothetical protein IFM89_018851 [Coptis chinensis]
MNSNNPLNISGVPRRSGLSFAVGKGGPPPNQPVVALYPGVTYSPAYYRYIPGYPRVDANNPYLITRYDGVVINAQPWGTGGWTRELWNGLSMPAVGSDVRPGTDRGSDLKPRDPSTGLTSNEKEELTCCKGSMWLYLAPPPLVFLFIDRRPWDKQASRMSLKS